jgi:hypothetical protein
LWADGLTTFRPEYEHHQTLRSLERAISEGCWICSVLSPFYHINWPTENQKGQCGINCEFYWRYVPEVSKGKCRDALVALIFYKIEQGERVQRPPYHYRLNIRNWKGEFRVSSRERVRLTPE